MSTMELVSNEQFVARGCSVPDVYFGADYGRAEKAAGAGDWFSLVGGGGEWLLPFHVRSDEIAADAVSPYGYAGVYAESGLPGGQLKAYWDAGLALLRDVGIVSLFLRQSPLFPSPFAHRPGVEVVRDHVTFAVCTVNPGAAWERMEGRSRTSIRRAEREGLRADLRPASRHDLTSDGPFRRLYSETMGRRGAAARYHFEDDYFDALLAGLGGDLSICEVSNPDGRVAAAALFMRCGGLLHYHLSGATVDAGRLGATNLLLWTAIEWAAGCGISRLHLGGGVSPGDGLFRFKRSFGGTALNYNAYGVVVDADAYDRASRVAAARHASMSEDEQQSYFPAYRRPV